MRYLTSEEILRIHHKVIQDYGGSHGVRDVARLKALVTVPRQHVFGEEQYKTVYEKAAVYLRNIIADHPFVDGNKRTALVCMGILLQRNDHPLRCEQKELEKYIVTVATKKNNIQQISKWLEAHTK